MIASDSITCSGLTKRFNETTALASLDLEVKSGEFLALLGPSGSGKTTLLNLIAGLLDPDEGEIRFGERRVDHLPPNKRDLALVFQSYALYPHMTVFENLAFPLKAKRGQMTPEEIEQRVKTVSGKLGIEHLLHRYPKELSGGQQQRVALGRGLVRNPKVFLLDEPLSNLDARLRIRMRADLKALHEELRSTVVYVTHDQSEAMALADRIAVFNLGVLQQVGTPDEVYNRPANTFVANFVGDREINFLPASHSTTGETTTFTGSGFRIELSHVAVPSGSEVVIGIRPEALSMCESADGNLHGIVKLTELVGPDLFAFVELGEGTVIVCRLNPSQQVEKGETIHLKIDARGTHVFDATEGGRL